MAVQKTVRGSRVTLSATKSGGKVHVGISSQANVRGANTRWDWRFEVETRRKFRWRYVKHTNTFGYVSSKSGSVRRVTTGGKTMRVKCRFYRKGSSKVAFTLTDRVR